jgi:hypothetical protein
VQYSINRNVKVEVRFGPLKCCFEVLCLKEACCLDGVNASIGILFCTFTYTAVVHLMSYVFDLFGKYSTVL